MKQSYILAMGLFAIAIIGVLGALGKLSGPAQRCTERGDIWTGASGAKCVERTPEMELRIKEGVKWTGK